jgi:hypothetical protein
MAELDDGLDDDLVVPAPAAAKAETFGLEAGARISGSLSRRSCPADDWIGSAHASRWRSAL